MRISKLGARGLVLLLGASSLLASSQGASAQSNFNVTVTVTITAVKPCCDNLSNADPFVKIFVPGQPTFETGEMSLGSDGDWHATNIQHSFVIPQNAPDAARTIQFELWDADGFLNGGDDHLDIIPGSGKDPFLLLDLRNFDWRRAPPDPNTFCPGPGSLPCIGNGETQNNAGGLRWNISYSVCGAGIQDSDGDGLFDDWELHGVDADCNPATQCEGCNAGIDVDLPKMGANPSHKDIFVELDYFPQVAPFLGQVPRQEAVRAVKQAFALAPLNATGKDNPDGLPGINLWVDMGFLIDLTGREGPNAPLGSCNDGINNNGNPAGTVEEQNAAMLIDGQDPACLTGDHLAGTEGAAGGQNSCTNYRDDDLDGKVDLVDEDCLRLITGPPGAQTATLAGGNALLPPGAPDILAQGIADMMPEFGCPPNERCVATNLGCPPGWVGPCVSASRSTGTCTVGQVPCAANCNRCLPESGYHASKRVNFSPLRELIFRYAMSLPPASVFPGLVEDGGASTCGDNIDANGNGADVNDPNCAAMVEDMSAAPNSCFDGVDNSGDGHDAIDPACLAGQEDPGSPTSFPGDCFDTAENGGGDLADALDPQCQNLSELLPGGMPAGPMSCFDLVDNGYDGLDRNDPDCQFLEGGVATGCYDGMDNDAGDGADAADPECGVLPSPVQTEDGVTAINACNDGVSNGFGTASDDSLVDGNDPDCWEDGKRYATCADTLDNMVDGVDGIDLDCGFIGGGLGELHQSTPYLPGNDFIDYNHDPATLMHELGHTLALHHGGSDAWNCRPPYVSIMNYLYAFGLPQIPGSWGESGGREDGAPFGTCWDGIDNGVDGADQADPECAWASCLNGADDDGDGLADVNGLPAAGAVPAVLPDPKCKLLDVANAAGALGPDGVGDDLIIDYAPARLPDGTREVLTGTIDESVLSETANLDADLRPDGIVVNPARNARLEGGLGNCDDGIDNDADSFTDGLDPNCAAQMFRFAEYQPANREGAGTCADGADNNLDGNIDNFDPACVGPGAPLALSGADFIAPGDGVADGIDWQQDGVVSAAPVQVNVNTQPAGDPAVTCLNTVISAGTVMTSHDDWTNIAISFRDSPTLDPLYLLDTRNLIEPTREQLGAMIKASRVADVAVSARGVSVPLAVGPNGEVVAPIRVSNVGPTQAFGQVTATFEFPPDATVVTVNGVCGLQSPGVLVCIIGPIAGFHHVDLDVEIELASCPAGPVLSVEVADPGGTDPKPSNDSLVLLEDNARPTIVAPPAIVTQLSAPALGTAVASDDCDPSPDIFNDAPTFFPYGTTVVEWWAVDDAGNESDHHEQLVTILGGDGSWTGTAFSCGVSRTGEVFCWGENGEGQLGDGTNTERWSPAAVDLSAVAMQVSVGSRHACAVLEDRTVECWGGGDDGRLGNGSTLDRSTPVAVSGLSGVRQVAAGGQPFIDDGHTCAVLETGAVSCWGEGIDGQLGDGHNLDRTQPVSAVFPVGTVVTQISAGGEHTCAVDETGTAYCWGEGFEGQLGYGGSSSRNVPTLVTWEPSPVVVTQIDCGADHTCAVDDLGKVYCWGEGDDGRLGHGGTGDRSEPTLVTGLPAGAEVVQVSAGAAHTCVVLVDGRVFCWGEGGSGRLGNGSTLDRTSPVEVTGVNQAIQVSAGSDHTCARTFDGTIYRDVCWGNNDDGQLGDGTSIDRTTAVAPALFCSGGTPPSTAAGGSSTCATGTAAAAQEVFCWGSNASGQLGDGTTVSRRAAMPATGTTLVSTVSVGSAHACAVFSGRTVKCWGSNGSGRLGDGTTTSRTTPTAINDTATYQMVSTGTLHTCGITAGPSPIAKCWGSGLDGRLGTGSTATQTSPAAVASLPGIPLWIDAGDAHSCAVVQNGPNRQIWCWGEGSDGRLGNNSIGDASLPVQVVGITNALFVSAGAAHSCASTLTGTVKCWGEGSNGRLGNGSLLDRWTPVTVIDTSNNPIVAAGGITAGGAHTCVANASATFQVACWGNNQSGELGDGTTTTRSRALKIASLLGVAAISAGDQHSCAQLLSGETLCWGSNGSGRLGDGTLSTRTTPTLVSGACN